MIPIGLRLAPLFALVVGIGVAFGAFLAYSAVRTAYLEAARSRMDSIAGTVAASADGLIAIGQPLAGQPALQETMRREAELVGALLRSIDISDGGSVLLSSDPARVGRASAAESGVLETFRSISNDLGIEAARVTVRYDAALIGASLDRLAGELLLSAAPVLAVAIAAGLFASIGIALLLLRSIRRVSDPGRMPAAARAALRSIEETHLAVARRLNERAARPEAAS